ncbi:MULTISPECIES: B3/4 domain-containing protein [Methanocalculus]|uniref:B3/B4 domain-containing protein n=1 Tax=Methanocalculus TaxID=71151 RepID=UPI00209D9EB6|nr:MULTISPECIES: phenylalanine--tRNA ligase beta subunit-related protein [unclassified Methanocalculus]MCP1662275.1 DNA/RNA-binding domain of Phe-tRNA-synthetase-like protein [Methanocalculus sp. AMF5]
MKQIQIHPDVLSRFPGIGVVEGVVTPLAITRINPDLERQKETIAGEIKARYTLDTVRDVSIFRAYRDFFWSVGVDPTKTRPASEALVRRILADKPLPTINTAVDAYNLASAETGIPLAAFDAATLQNGICMRFARNSEEFLGIGMKSPIILHENQVVLTDGEGSSPHYEMSRKPGSKEVSDEPIIAVYPFRDSDATKITTATTTIYLVACGIPGIAPEMVEQAYDLALGYLTRYAGAEDTRNTIPTRVKDQQ